ncbi:MULTISPECIES: hypothetical protein [unclassified Clostridium]|uniref:hypothetical protein n=1 Tax=unclassified Clostridium TaxID=2614128 RepID=UPI00207A5570|nr:MULTISPECIES: hypothetical protein [unclassified Clostridium]
MNEISLKFESLEKMISTIQQDLNTNEQIFLACIALVAALSIPAIIFYVKAVVNQRIEKELVKIKENIKSEIKIESNKYYRKRKNFKCVYGEINVGNSNQVGFSLDMSEREFNTLPWNLELYYSDFPEQIIFYSTIFSGNCITIFLKNHDIKYGEYINYKMTWLSEEILID